MKTLLGMFITILVATGSAQAQNSVFGKNKVQYKNFEWQYIQTSHFDVYFSQDGYDLVDAGACG